MNLQVTSVIAQLSQFKHPQLQEFLLNASLPLAPDCRSLHSTLQNVSCFKIITIHCSSVTLFCVKYFTHTFTVRPVKLGFHIIFWIIPQVEFEGKQIWIYEHTNMTGIPQITLKITCVSLACGQRRISGGCFSPPESTQVERSDDRKYVCVPRLCFLGLAINIIWKTPSMMP